VTIPRAALLVAASLASRLGDVALTPGPVDASIHAPASLPIPGISDFPANAFRTDQSPAELESALKRRAAAVVAGRVLSATTNQTAYDVHFYDIDLTVDLSDSSVTGSVTTLATVTAGPLTTLDLDLYANMTVDSVAAGGTNTSFTRTGDVLTINLDRTYMTDEVVEVFVDYHGVPVGDQYFKYFNVSSLVGKPLIWTLSQPFGARSWWPCKDHPSDKADSVDIRIQVPTGLLTASNGTRVEETDDGTWAVTRWRERYPISESVQNFV
jgi:aminopeptidase N